MPQETYPAVDRYAVFGNPVAHSRSPEIHAQFAQQTGQTLRYEKILAPLDGFATAIATFQQAGGRGCNVTLPFKGEACALAHVRSERAERAQAVNTLRCEADGTLFGDNTDGVGLLRDLTVNHCAHLEGQRILLLGAGGAARGILAPLLATRPARLVIANRTAERAAQLARGFADLGTVTGGGLDALAAEAGFDLILNATAAGVRGEMPPLPETILAEGGWCYDLYYARTPTPFLRWARQHGAAHTLDGLGMLVEQAAESFHLWRGLRPETTPVIEALRAGL